jgi:hypothetical protein
MDADRERDAELRAAADKELDWIARMAERVSQATDYPIDSLERLKDALGTDFAVMEIGGRPVELEEIGKFALPNLLPIESRGDLVAKATTTVAIIPGSALAQLEGDPGEDDEATREKKLAELERNRPDPRGTLMFSSIKTKPRE